MTRIESRASVRELVTRARRAVAPGRVLGAALVAGTALTAAPACAQSSDPLPPCEWCGTAEAPADLDWSVTIPAEDEPGEPLLLEGVVYEPDGETPAAGVILYAYHTNAEGVYPKRGDETGNARRHGYLRGWLRTDERGRYRIRTIRPASYPSRNAPAHIHMTVKEPDDTPEYWLPTFHFAGDPLLEDAEGDYVLELRRNGNGVWGARQDIVLPEEPRR